MSSLMPVFVAFGLGVFFFLIGILIIKNPPSDCGIPDEFQREVDNVNPTQNIGLHTTILAFLSSALAIAYALYKLVVLMSGAMC